MPNISFARKGTGSAAGVITMRPEPDFTGGKNDAGALGIAAFSDKNADVRITGTATVAMQATNGDPTVAAGWETIGSLSASGNISTDAPWEFIRFNVTSYSSGDVIVDFQAYDS